MIEVIASASGIYGAFPWSSSTTDAFDSTGGEDLIVGTSMGGDADNTITDTESNSFDKLNRFNSAAGSVQLSLAESMITGASHTVTSTRPYSASSVFAIVTKGLADSPYHSSSSASGSGGTLQTGEVTPPVDGCLIVSQMGSNDGTFSVAISDGLTLITEDVAGTVKGAIAWFIQETAAPINLTWTLGGGNNKQVSIAVFLPAEGGGPAIDPLSGGIPGSPLDPLRW